MANRYVAIDDVLIEGYKPVTSRLMRRYARNVDSIGWRPLRGWNANGSSASASFVEVATTHVFIPDCCVGEDGVRLSLRLTCTATGDGVSSNTGSFRFQVDGNTSNTAARAVVPPSTTNAGSNTLTCDFTPSTSNSVYTVSLQVSASDGTNPSSISFPVGYHEASFIASLPRSV